MTVKKIKNIRFVCVTKYLDVLKIVMVTSNKQGFVFMVEYQLVPCAMRLLKYLLFVFLNVMNLLVKADLH